MYASIVIIVILIISCLLIWSHYETKLYDAEQRSIREQQTKRINENVNKKLKEDKITRTFDDAFVEGDCEWCEEDAAACEFCGICKLSEDEEDEDV